MNFTSATTHVQVIARDPAGQHKAGPAVHRSGSYVAFFGRCVTLWSFACPYGSPKGGESSTGIRREAGSFATLVYGWTVDVQFVQSRVYGVLRAQSRTARTNPCGDRDSLMRVSLPTDPVGRTQQGLQCGLLPCTLLPISLAPHCAVCDLTLYAAPDFHSNPRPLRNTRIAVRTDAADAAVDWRILYHCRAAVRAGAEFR